MNAQDDPCVDDESTARLPDVQPRSEAGAVWDEVRDRGPDVALRVVFSGIFLLITWPMMVPLTLGGLAAIVLTPLDRAMAKRLGRLARGSTALVTGATALGVLAPLSWIAWQGLAALNGFVSTLMVGGVSATHGRIVAALTEAFDGSVSEAAISQRLDTVVGYLASSLGSLASAALKALPQGITDVFLFVVALYFGLRDGARLVAYMRRVAPISPLRTEQVFDTVQSSVKGTLMGMFAVALVQGSLAFLAMWACGVDGALLWACFAAVCSAMPIVGTTPITLGAAAWLALQGRPVAAAAMLAAAVVIGLSDNLVRPWVQSAHDHIHPLVALVAIFGGLAVFGPAGLVFGPVLASMARWSIEAPLRAHEQV